MRPPLRIGILQCDTPIGKTKEKYGTYGNLFQELLENGAKKLSEQDGVPVPGLDLLKYDVVDAQAYPSLDEVDAILMTGSKHNAFDNDPWILKLVEFTRKVLAQDRVRLIGVCFGHQIIGRALDVKVDRGSKGWEVSVSKVALTAKGKEIFGLDELAIHQMHRDIVYEYPPHIEALGHSPRCDVQGMYAKNRLISVQGHPEFSGDIVAELLDARLKQGIFDNIIYEDGMDRVRKPHDGVVISAAFLRFLLVD